METSSLLLVIMTATLAGVSLQAWRLGSERRDVALLAACSGLCGLGAATTALL